ncbi:Protein kinase domain-containing protein, related [Neospora caninum Liverpool]|uniref:Protein kinase domain-containing protein, related n=1 Tax=Neospora caninum (strain Liverpool) TaxID=572307 RepID=F0VDK5_NEOCL|nr:Protein kinase domain-containing protein, related [Neospora caninum Liverpool]CBZ51798.1 Protein kinase domain-containing protein, related [Neospora caninum Liverpool]CEL65757.1 TPA: Protein kinase domain-containing protein, related [Neospora caninum Liverpool]|eukprot:XP_003881831.1 Protein kinase domain-containing protein, related [Neospora caninum Liverpool]
MKGGSKQMEKGGKKLEDSERVIAGGERARPNLKEKGRASRTTHLNRAHFHPPRFASSSSASSASSACSASSSSSSTSSFSSPAASRRPSVASASSAAVDDRGHPVREGLRVASPSGGLPLHSEREDTRVRSPVSPSVEKTASRCRRRSLKALLASPEFALEELSRRNRLPDRTSVSPFPFPYLNLSPAFPSAERSNDPAARGREDGKKTSQSAALRRETCERDGAGERKSGWWAWVKRRFAPGAHPAKRETQDGDGADGEAEGTNESSPRASAGERVVREREGEGGFPTMGHPDSAEPLSPAAPADSDSRGRAAAFLSAALPSFSPQPPRAALRLCILVWADRRVYRGETFASSVRHGCGYTLYGGGATGASASLAEKRVSCLNRATLFSQPRSQFPLQSAFLSFNDWSALALLKGVAGTRDVPTVYRQTTPAAQADSLLASAQNGLFPQTADLSSRLRLVDGKGGTGGARGWRLAGLETRGQPRGRAAPNAESPSRRRRGPRRDSEDSAGEARDADEKLAAALAVLACASPRIAAGYCGHWEKDQRSGWGVFVRGNSGLKYEGFWRNDCREGLGVQTLAQGVRFVGCFRRGVRHGKGVLFQPNGSLYAGEWENGYVVKQELLFFGAFVERDAARVETSAREARREGKDEARGPKRAEEETAGGNTEKKDEKGQTYVGSSSWRRAEEQAIDASKVDSAPGGSKSQEIGLSWRFSQTEKERKGHTRAGSSRSRAQGTGVEEAETSGDRNHVRGRVTRRTCSPTSSPVIDSSDLPSSVDEAEERDGDSAGERRLTFRREKKDRRSGSRAETSGARQRPRSLLSCVQLSVKNTVRYDSPGAREEERKRRRRRRRRTGSGSGMASPCRCETSEGRNEDFAEIRLKEGTPRLETQQPFASSSSSSPPLQSPRSGGEAADDVSASQATVELSPAPTGAERGGRREEGSRKAKAAPVTQVEVDGEQRERPRRGPGEDEGEGRSRRVALQAASAEPSLDGPAQSPRAKQEERKKMFVDFQRQMNEARRFSSAAACEEWGTSEVAHFFACQGFPLSLREILIAQDIDGSALLQVQEEDLEEMGVHAWEDRRLVLLVAGILHKLKRRHSQRTLYMSPEQLQQAQEVVATLEIPAAEVSLEGRVGEGGYSRVYRARWRYTRSLELEQQRQALLQYRQDVHNYYAWVHQFSSQSPALQSSNSAQNPETRHTCRPSSRLPAARLCSASSASPLSVADPVTTETPQSRLSPWPQGGGGHRSPPGRSFAEDSACPGGSPRAPQRCGSELQAGPWSLAPVSHPLRRCPGPALHPSAGVQPSVYGPVPFPEPVPFPGTSSAFVSSTSPHLPAGPHLVPPPLPLPLFPAPGAARSGPAFPGDMCVAVKVFRQRELRALQRSFFSELSVLCRLTHPNIAMLLGVVSAPLYGLVTEYVPAGSLFDMLHVRRIPLSFTQVVRFGRDICHGMRYLHEQGVLHCDLKSPNVLLGKRGEIKLCDFGLATLIDAAPDADAQTRGRRGPLERGERERRGGRDANLGSGEDKPSGRSQLQEAHLGCVGTHHWMAPEVLRGEPFTAAADVYSFGMVLWEMLARKIPFEGMNSPAHIITAVGYGGAAPVLSPSPPPLREIVARCLSHSPQNRPSFAWCAQQLQALHAANTLDVEMNLNTLLGLE